MPTGTIRIVMDRCMKWSCEDCWVRKFAGHVQHLYGRLEPVALRLDTMAPGLQKRANRLKAGYMRVNLRKVRMPVIMAEPHLFPDARNLEVSDALIQVLKAGRDNGISRISFNTPWRQELEGTHEYLGMGEDLTLKEVEQAIEFAGFDNMNIGTVPVEKARNRIESFLNGVDWDLSTT